MICGAGDGDATDDQLSRCSSGHYQRVGVPINRIIATLAGGAEGSLIIAAVSNQPVGVRVIAGAGRGST